jgi:hypothetical protein
VYRQEAAPSSIVQNSKIVITGDDILIEYVSRIVSKLRLIDDDFHEEDELTERVHL